MLTSRLRAVFSDRRVIIDTADGPASAVILVHTHGYDAILLRQPMQGRLGFRFIEQIRLIRPKVRMVVMGDVHTQRDYRDTELPYPRRWCAADPHVSSGDHIEIHVLDGRTDAIVTKKEHALDD